MRRARAVAPFLRSYRVTPLAIETELRDLIDRNLPADSAPRVYAFAERLFARDSADNRERVPAKRRLALVQSAFEFFSVRTEPAIARVASVAGDDNDTLAVVETVTTDCPFIVDSLLEYFHHLGATVRTMLHPVFKVARDKQGRIASFEQLLSAERGESFVHAELELTPTPEQAREIEREVISILSEVHDATGDFEQMTGRALQICEETASNRELIEVRDLLRWLIHGGFVFLGYRRYLVSGEDGTARFVLDPGTELGVMREHDESRFRSSVMLEELSAARRKLFFEGPPVVIGKTRAESHVHRRRPMDSVSIRRTDASGQVVAFDNFIGLFTSKAHAEEAQHIPVLRAKLREVLEYEGAAPGSHDYKEIVSAFNSFPKDELFRAPVAELRAQLRLILDVKSSAAVRLFVAPDLRHGNVIALVVMPREAGSAELGRRIQDTLAAALHGTLVYFHLALGEGYTARLHFCFVADPPKTSVIRSLETTIANLARRWDDRLQERLIEKFGPRRGRELAERWAGAFSADYQAAIDIARAVADIEDVENANRRWPRFHGRGRTSRVQPPRRRRTERHTYCRARRRSDALRPDAHFAELRDPGAVRGRSRTAPAHGGQSDARVPAGLFRGGTRLAAIRKISRRCADRRRDRRGARRPYHGRFSQRAHAHRGPRLARGRSAAHVSGRRVPDAPGALPSQPAARSVAVSRPRQAAVRTVYRTPLVRQPGRARKNRGVARSVSRASRCDRKYC